MYRLSFVPAAGRRWGKLIRRMPVADYEALETAMEALADNPRAARALKLSGERDTYRLRVGDYRVIYKVDDSLLSVVISKVSRRSESTLRRVS